MPLISCDYGYDVHCAEISHDVAAKIARNESVSFMGQGFSHEEEGLLDDEWTFDGLSHSIKIRLDSDAEIIANDFWISEG